MKLVFIIGNTAVGKMTVGQALMATTDLKLFHNHMIIEPVIEVFGTFKGDTISKLREVIFKDFAASDQAGMIFTYMWAFDQQSDWDYIESVKDIFAPYGTEFYYIELVADKDERLKRNKTENRLLHKASKRDLDFSNHLFELADNSYRCESDEGEIPFDNYLRIDNTHLSPEVVAAQIKAHFNL